MVNIDYALKLWTAIHDGLTCEMKSNVTIFRDDFK